MNRKITLKTFGLLFVGLLTSLFLQAQEHDHQHDHHHDDEYNISVFQQSKAVYSKQQKTLRQAPAWTNFKAQNGAWTAHFDERTEFPRKAAGKGISLIHNGDLEEKAVYFFQNVLNTYDLPVADFKLKQINTSDKYHYVKFKQYYQGVKIFNSDIQVRFTKDDRVVSFVADAFDNVSLNTQASLSLAQIEPYISNDLEGSITYDMLPEVQILAVPEDDFYTYKLVYVGNVKVESTDSPAPALYFTIVDAHDGTIYYRQNQVFNHQPSEETIVALSGSVSDNPTLEPQDYVLSHALVRVENTNYYTNAEGMLELPSFIEGPVEAQVSLRGKFCRIVNEQTNSTPSIDITLEAGENKIFANDWALLQEVSAYYHTNRIHDFMKQYLPADFTRMDDAMRTNVEIDDPSGCNAFYDGSSINFYKETNCWPTSLYGDVIYHEYGHGINENIYRHFDESFRNSALHEGYSDVWALALQNAPIIGKGFYKNSPDYSFIRRYDRDIKIHPNDTQNPEDFYRVGEVIAGSWWDLIGEIGVDAAMKIFGDTHYATPMAFDGNEEALYFDILMEAYLVDDDDGDILNGTPNSIAISKAFRRHGLSLAGNISLEHKEVLTNKAAKDIKVYAAFDVGKEEYLKGLYTYYRLLGETEWQQVSMEYQDIAAVYKGVIPPQSGGTIIEYYISAEDIFNASLREAPYNILEKEDPIPYYVLVGYDSVQEDDLSAEDVAETWTVGLPNDDARNGEWTIGKLYGTYDSQDNEVQPRDDHSDSSDDICAYTGESPSGVSMNFNDIDEGTTTLLSPVFDLTAYNSPIISYYRWFTNSPAGGANPGQDPWTVYISDNPINQSSWVEVENTVQSDNSWRRIVVDVNKYVEESDNIQLKFVASDLKETDLNLDGASMVEAAVDDLFVYELTDDTVYTPEEPTEEPEEEDPNVPAIATEDLTAAKIAFYPNPANEQIWMQIAAESPLKGTFNLSVHNIEGKLVEERKLNIDKATYKIDCSTWQSGVYFISLSNDQQNFRQRMVVERD